MRIFGITGTIGAGKGTIVDYLVNEKGELVAFFPSKVKPLDNEIISKIK